MHKIKLTKLSDNPNKLRTNEVIGFCPKMPEVGEPFFMYSEGLEAGIRYVATSNVKSITSGSFKTLNSEYKLELM